MMFISYDEIQKKEKRVKELKAARERARNAVEDAKRRYIKDKTRAKSKAAAAEKDAILNSARFKVLDEYAKFGDILEAYGWDYISEAEKERLEDLWKEREEIRNHVEDGIYKDNVTDALWAAETFLVELWQNEIDAEEKIIKDFYTDAIINGQISTMPAI